ncbi:MAG: hypothetical protein IJ159_00255 [Prevotella sp.]|nr:hypothetical protein [Prevotella sp.]
MEIGLYPSKVYLLQSVGGICNNVKYASCKCQMKSKKPRLSIIGGRGSS